jgi:hypothetical protein
MFTAAERRDLWTEVAASDRFHAVWPEYNHPDFANLTA